jgi:NhaP-type Na+/H+ or K+/H+ antiporter
MDQTPVYFSMTPKRMLALKGARTVDARSSTSSTVRVTVAVTITASGVTLPFLLVFKGRPGKKMQKDGDKRQATPLLRAKEGLDVRGYTH